MTNGQWAGLEPLLPQGMKPGRPPVWTRRQLIEGIRWRTRTGAPWRDVPERYGPWDRVYDLFRRWQRDGTWVRIVTQLQAEADVEGLIAWDVNVDSTVCRARPPARGRVGEKGDLSKRTARRCCSRAGRPRPRTLPRGADHEDPPRGRAGAKASASADHGPAARRFSAVRGCH
ncbi:transposase [Streptomyces aureus]